MKTLVATVALAAVIASPALAQTARRAPVQQYQSQYDQSYGRSENQPRSNHSGNDVYDQGHYLGTDPDPNVRLDLRRDYEHRD
jgi:opacity protein-like surface antigen